MNFNSIYEFAFHINHGGHYYQNQYGGKYKDAFIANESDGFVFYPNLLPILDNEDTVIEIDTVIKIYTVSHSYDKENSGYQIFNLFDPGHAFHSRIYNNVMIEGEQFKKLYNKFKEKYKKTNQNLNNPDSDIFKHNYICSISEYVGENLRDRPQLSKEGYDEFCKEYFQFIINSNCTSHNIDENLKYFFHIDPQGSNICWTNIDGNYTFKYIDFSGSRLYEHSELMTEDILYKFRFIFYSIPHIFETSAKLYETKQRLLSLSIQPRETYHNYIQRIKCILESFIHNWPKEQLEECLANFKLAAEVSVSAVSTEVLPGESLQKKSKLEISVSAVSPVSPVESQKKSII